MAKFNFAEFPFQRLYGKSVGGASTRLDRSPTTRTYGLFTPLRGPCSPGSVPVGTFQTVSLGSTLAIWSRITSHRLGSLQRPLGLFVGWSLRATRKKCPCKGLTVVGKFIPRKGAREYKPY